MTTLHYMNGSPATTHDSDESAIAYLADNLACTTKSLQIRTTSSGRWVDLWTFTHAGMVVARLA